MRSGEINDISLWDKRGNFDIWWRYRVHPVEAMALSILKRGGFSCLGFAEIPVLWLVHTKFKLQPTAFGLASDWVQTSCGLEKCSWVTLVLHGSIHTNYWITSQSGASLKPVGCNFNLVWTSHYASFTPNNFWINLLPTVRSDWLQTIGQSGANYLVWTSH